MTYLMVSDEPSAHCEEEIETLQDRIRLLEELCEAQSDTIAALLGALQTLAA